MPTEPVNFESGHRQTDGKQVDSHADRSLNPAWMHLGPHDAVVLIGPVVDELQVLEERLAWYAERAPLADADREAIERARGIVAAARAELLVVRAASQRADAEPPAGRLAEEPPTNSPATVVEVCDA